MPRVENMSKFYNPIQPSHVINGSLIRKRRVYAPHELRQARTVGGPSGLNQGPAYLTRSRSSPVRRPRSYSRSPSKTSERRRSTQNHPPAHLLDAQILDLVPDPDLFLIPEVDLDLPHTVDLIQDQDTMSPHGKDKLPKFLDIRKIF